MKVLKSHNNQLICTPFKNAFVTTKKVGNLDMINAPTGLVALTVLMDGWISIAGIYQTEVHSGDIVYVRAEQYTTSWAKSIKECDEIKDKDGKLVRFIIVPGSEVIFVSSEVESCCISRPKVIPAGPKVE